MINRLGLPRTWKLLVLIVLVFRLATALPLQYPGYMDASYTFHVAGNLARGQGLTEEILWNYLDQPVAIPHPSNLYWLPLPAFLAAGSFLLFGISYHAAQIPFILLSIVPPLLAFYLTRRIFKRDDYAWMAGLLTAFSGLYTIYWVGPDNFAPFAVTAGLALLFMAWGVERIEGAPGAGNVFARYGYWFAAGALAGLSQLARADAFLLVGVVPFLLLLRRRPFRLVLLATLVAGLGFVIVMMPWLARNYAVAGSFLAPGGTSTFFLRSYDELFSYHVDQLTLARYLDWGMGNILLSKLRALIFDVELLALGLQVYMLPLALIGIWQWRRRAEFQVMLIYLTLLLGAMVLLFTYPNTHGSMLHSSVALLAFFAAAVPAGLDAVIHWIAHRRRQWNERSAGRFFRVGFTLLAIGISLFTYGSGVMGNPLGGPLTSPLWNDRDSEYRAVDQELAARGVPRDQPVLTVDPPSFINQTGRRSIITPTDSVDALFQAARQFGAHYLVLQDDHAAPLADLYYGKAQIDGLILVARFQDAIGRPVILYEVVEQ
ncbi:MAG: glycosyltransferase family 39 protein [Anaerolineae bacterium]